MPDKKLTDNEIIKALEDIIKHLDFTQIKSGENVLANALDLINRLQAENERLRVTIDCFTNIGKMCSEIKAEAYKEFAERLCEDRVANDPVVIATKCLLKELTEKLN